MLLRSLYFILLPTLLSAQGLQPSLLTTLDPPLHETSGLLIVDGQVWTHGDSGNPNSLYRIDPTTGSLLREVVLSNAPNVDWEEVTTDGNWVYVGDFGNNLGSRTDLRVFRVALDQLLDEQVNSLIADTIRFSYADQTDFTPANQATNWDCEAFIAKDDSLFLFTKNWADQRCHLYALPAWPGDHLAVRRDTLEAMGLVTGAAYEPDNGVIALIGYSNLLAPFVWRLSDFSGNAFFNGVAARYPIQLAFTQTEAIAWHTPDTVLLSNESGLFGTAGLWSLYLGASVNIASTGGNAPLRLQPNPARDRTRIVGLEGPAHVRLLNEQGAEVWQGPVQQEGQLSVEGFMPGSYTMEVRNGKGAPLTLRLMVVH